MRLRYSILIPLLGFGTWVGHTALAAPAPARKPVKKAVKPAAKPAAAQPTLVKNVAPLLDKYCGNCHGPGKEMAGIAIHGYKSEADLVKHRDLFEKIAHSLRTGHMPPKGLPAPTATERALISGFVEARFARLDCDLRDPGRVTMRRLNRVEYNNTIRDLFRIDLRPADEFPSDDVGYGFDNIGDVLTISPLLMEKYMAAAEKVARRAIQAPEDQSGVATRFEGERPKETGGAGVVRTSDRLLVSTGEVSVIHAFPKEGEYILRARAFGQQAGTEPAKMSFQVDGKELKLFEVAAVEANPSVYEFRTKIPAGRHRFAAAFTNDFYDQKNPDPKNRDRNLGVDYLEIAGPIEPLGTVSESHASIFVCGCKPGVKHTAQCARSIVTPLATRAFRRPATPAEVNRLVKYVALAEKEGESFERGVQLAVQAVLASPHFLFRVELDPAAVKPGSIRPLNDYELATRLSYFLWSSMPDEELFQLAAAGKLKTPKVTAQQVNRMLKDPKAKALMEGFGEQWLTLRNLANFNPDGKRFPTWNEDLRKAMLTETQLFFQSIVKEDRSILEFLDSDFTFVNERLAKHYGISGVTGEQFQRVKLEGDHRGGLLGQASILAITSNPTRTSPVKRGKWVMEQLLGTPPPPPPPNVPELEQQEGKLTGTLRQRMEQHRKDPLCASCHTQMDAIGFGLENFDALGAWRTNDGEGPVDPSGTLPNGKSFQGPAELRKILKEQDRLFARNFTEKLLTFALGRGVEKYDRCNLDAMTASVGKQGFKLSTVVHEIVKSEPFRMRRPDPVR